PIRKEGGRGGGLSPHFREIQPQVLDFRFAPPLITAALKEFEENETSLCPLDSAPTDSMIKEESLLYANKSGRHGSRGGFKTKFEDFDWGNQKKRDGVCFRCGRS